MFSKIEAYENQRFSCCRKALLFDAPTQKCLVPTKPYVL